MTTQLEGVDRTTTSTVIADIQLEGRELVESELAAIIGGVAAAPVPAGGSFGSGGTGGSCGGCH